MDEKLGRLELVLMLIIFKIYMLVYKVSTLFSVMIYCVRDIINIYNIFRAFAHLRIF